MEAEMPLAYEAEVDEASKLPGVPDMDLGGFEGLIFRCRGGILQYALSDNIVDNAVWHPNGWSRRYRPEFWDWVDKTVAAMTPPKPKGPQPEVKDEDVELAIKYTALKHALDEIKHILKERKPPLDEILEIARNALEDSE